MTKQVQKARLCNSIGWEAALMMKRTIRKRGSKRECSPQGSWGGVLKYDQRELKKIMVYYPETKAIALKYAS